MNNECKLRCQTCNKMKHDTAFEITKDLRYKTDECLDCKYPDRWDKIKQACKDIGIPVKNNLIQDNQI